MPLDNVYVTSHIHVDGPIPGPHSLLSLTSVAHTADGVPITTFTTNPRELPGATLHPVALKSWRHRAEDWLTTHRASRPPAIAMTAYSRWVEQLPGRPVFVADSEAHDYLFLYWYLQRFTGRWPFARTSTNAAVREQLPNVPVCTLISCREPLAQTS
ncbi:hypothetical protein [Pseudonocardia asaccharolytica]|uniref:Uncharacterized protein n=1 Tax=Pseudonocardia asaccharolytica DSM 44247 = NBRC 16224 TaxID=1123024 RepID=A0A511D4J6_9PSEU|nr:hypothetical protein [Pseudonocardia asaccharolytica]GEL19701.1 hypothetical protein PA7_35380 [Pseudonocardia asaccharolytica DSM 44247 = NBRC 16224]